MGFSCGCDDSDYEYLESYSGLTVYNGHKTRRCCECGCELAPGHTVHVDTWVDMQEEPFDDIEDEDYRDELLANAVHDYSCEKCSDLAESVLGLGMCYETGELWGAYFEWLQEERKPINVRKGK